MRSTGALVAGASLAAMGLAGCPDNVLDAGYWACPCAPGYRCVDGACVTPAEADASTQDLERDVAACDPNRCDALPAPPCRDLVLDIESCACVQQVSADGTACEDGDPCSGPDRCDSGQCAAGPERACTCDGVDPGGCETSYGDGNACNGELRCVDGQCRVDAASIISCTQPTDPCLEAVCDPATAHCVEIAALPPDEVCDAVDNDCDGETDEEGALGCTTYFQDDDEDTFGVASSSRCLCEPANPFVALVGTDCDDDDAGVHPEAPDLCDGINNDCSSLTPDGQGDPALGEPCDGDDIDACKEGKLVCQSGVLACTDDAAGIAEACDGVDNDCDEGVDEPNAEGCQLWYADADGDGAAGADTAACLCAPAAPYMFVAPTDCDDANAAVVPGAPDLCDGVDNDCDAGSADGAGDPMLLTPCDGSDDDQCEDGVRGCEGGVLVCEDDPQSVVETCDGSDNDCDGLTDEEGATGCQPYFSDSDGDGSAGGASKCLCQPTEPFIYASSKDCDDEAPTINPAAPEVCDGIDNDCDPATPDGQADPQLGAGCDGDDADLCQDGALECVAGTLACNDDSTAIEETCDGADNDCDGATDEADALGCTFYYQDIDGDEAAGTSSACLCVPTGSFTFEQATDCADLDPSVHPGAVEVCDSIDNDCDPLTPDGAEDPGLALPCDAADDDLCEDDEPACSEGEIVCLDDGETATEACGGGDEDCDGELDEADALGCVVHYQDLDGDGAASTTRNACLCAPSAPYLHTEALDCDDAAPAVHPGAPDLCDGVDNDCDPESPDGVDDPALQVACDAADADACPDDVPTCADAEIVCVDDGSTAVEACNGVDDDCDGETDEADAQGCSPHYLDQDGDGAAGDLASACLCAPAAPWSHPEATDCDDSAPTVFPGAPELCDGVDSDCDPSTADGSGDPQVGVPCDGGDSDLCQDGQTACEDGVTVCGDDAASSLESPLAGDSCTNGLDDDCDMATDALDSACLNTQPMARLELLVAAASPGETFLFDAASSSDLEDPPADLAYLWDTGNGFEPGGDTHTAEFSTVGAHLVRLMVIDTDGLADVAERTVVVATPSKLALVDTDTLVEASDGKTSLPEALSIANASFGTVITFAGPMTIQLQQALVLTGAGAVVAAPTGVLLVGDALPGGSTSTGSCLTLDGLDQRVYGLQVSGCPQYGIRLNGTDGQAAHCTVDSCGSGVRVGGEGNTAGPGLSISNSADDGAEFYGSGGRLTGSTIIMSGDNAVYMSSSSDDGMVDGNVVVQSNASGISATDSAGAFDVWHNTVVSTGFAGINPPTSASSGWTVYNNILVDAASYGLSEWEGLSYDGNLYWANPSAPVKGASVGPNGVVADPSLLDPVGDPRIRPTSGARGTALQLGLDRNGARPGLFEGAGPDVGAYEVIE